MPDIPTYIVSTGIVGDGVPSWATYVRKPNGSLRRIISKVLPLRETRIEALRDLADWLGEKGVSSGPAGYTEFLRQRVQVEAEWHLAKR